MNTEYVKFPERADRTVYIAKRFAAYLKGSVLDVGCYEAPLRKLLVDTPYTGVDMVGDPDITLNLEDCERLPFEDNSFECVLCIEVLEHLDTLHRMFGELFRVARRHVIVSLPNCWSDARRPIERGKGHFGHYALPIDAPLDRHKWFFSFTEARDFLEGQARQRGVQIADMFGTERPRNGLQCALRRLIFPGDRYLNRYAQNIWGVFDLGEGSK